jgi:hypothetical protein
MNTARIISTIVSNTLNADYFLAVHNGMFCLHHKKNKKINK